MVVSKEYKNQIIESYLSVIKKWNFLNLSDKDLGFFIRAFHVNLPLYFIICMIYGSKVQNTILLFFLILAFISFILFNGCILSKIENKIDGEDITIIDPFLDSLRMEKTTKNRMRISFIIAFFYLSFAFVTFYYRFGFSISIEDFIMEYNNNIKIITNIFGFFTCFFISKKNTINITNTKEIYETNIQFDELRI
jgi:hypothetical protein